MATTQRAKPPRKAPLTPVTLRTLVNGAREVVLTGDFTGWARDRFRLSKGPGDEWTGRIELAPGTYQYRLLVDGEWSDDPAAGERVPNDFGTENCILRVS